MLAPLIYILFDIKVFVSNLDEAIAYTSTYIVVNLMLQNYLYGSVRWPWISELYEYLQGVFLARAIVAVAANPRKPTFNVTAKGLTLDKDHLSELSWPFFAIYAVLALGSATAMWRYFNEPGVAELMLVVGLWNTFNLLVAGAALGAVSERKQPDRHPRLGIARIGFLTCEEFESPVRIVNVSAGGCGVCVDGGALNLSPGQTRALLYLEPMGERVTSNDPLSLVFRHASTNSDQVVYGFEFEQMGPREYFVLADLMYGDADALPRFLATRRKHKSLLAGTAQFIAWGVFEPLRAFSYLMKASPEPAPQADSAPPEPSTVWLHRMLALGKGKPAADRSRSKAA